MYFCDAEEVFCEKKLVIYIKIRDIQNIYLLDNNRRYETPFVFTTHILRVIMMTKDVIE